MGATGVGQVLVLGGGGFVGSRALELWGAELGTDAPPHAELDVLDPGALERYLQQSQAQVVLNLCAWAGVDDAEAERGLTSGRVYRLNTLLPQQLAELCRTLSRRKHFVHVSTDYVFDGTRAERPYREDDPTRPLSWYAQTKEAGERLAVQANPDACIARIEMPFAAHSSRKSDLARLCKSQLERGQPMVGVVDQRITPVFLDDCVQALRRLVERAVHGIIHIAPTDWTTPYDFCVAVAGRLGLDASLVQPRTFEVFAASRPAPRPQHSWLAVERFQTLFGSTLLRGVEAELDAWAALVEDQRSQSG